MTGPTTGDVAGLTRAARHVLEVASELFYRRGLHAVGVDTIAAESGVTKRTLYDRFGSKDALIAAYLTGRDRRWRDLVTARLEAAGDDPVRRVLVPFDVLADWLEPGNRGCALINAFAELPDADHPARAVAVGEKRWLRDLFVELLVAAGVADPGTRAVQLLSLHEGAVISDAIAGETGAAAPRAPLREALITR